MTPIISPAFVSSELTQTDDVFVVLQVERCALWANTITSVDMLSKGLQS